MARWTKGTSGNPAGRPRGLKNRATLAGRDVAAGLLSDEAYREAFMTAWRLRTIPPQMEALVWQLVHGRPRAAIAVELDAAIRAAPFELRGPAGELLSLVVPAVGSFEWRDGGFDFTPAELPPAGLLSKRDDDDES